MKTHKGFTLIELVSVIVIAAIVATIIGKSLATGFYSYIVGAALNPLSNQGTIAMSRMTQDFQNAIRFTTISATSVTFTDADNNTIQYDNTSCGANTLCLTRNGGTPATLATGLTALTFAYYNNLMAVTATASAVRAVTINMTLVGSNTNTLSLVNAIYLRNM